MNDPSVYTLSFDEWSLRSPAWLKGYSSDKFLMEIHLRTTGCRLPYGITQYYLPPDSSEHTPPEPQPVKAGTRLTYPGGMEG